MSKEINCGQGNKIFTGLVIEILSYGVGEKNLIFPKKVTVTLFKCIA